MQRARAFAGLAAVAACLTLAAPAAAAPAKTSPAADLRVSLDRLLAEHAFLTIEQMRSSLTAAPDLAAVAKSVEGNSADVAAAMGRIYGQSAEQPFGDVWRSHIGYLADYATALGKNDQSAQQSALDGLATYRTNIHQLLGQVNPGVDLGAIDAALDQHTAQLVEFIRAEHGRDHDHSYAIEREAYPHMFMVGDALAKVIANEFPDRYAGLDVAYSGAGTLRVTLDRLLGEHMFLTAEVLRGGLTGAPWYDAATRAVDENSKAVAELVGGAYGSDARDTFLTRWRAHITAYLGYIAAVRANDAAAKATAVQDIDTAAASIADLLSGANPKLDRAAVLGALQDHAAHLLRQVDAYATGDYEGAYGLGREGYEHMFMVGETLATAIARQLPAKFPGLAAPPNTATLDEHTAHHPAGLTVPWLVLGVEVAVLVAGTGMVLLGRRARRLPSVRLRSGLRRP